MKRGEQIDNYGWRQSVFPRGKTERLAKKMAKRARRRDEKRDPENAPKRNQYGGFTT